MSGYEILTLALGSNLGDRMAYLRKAASMLEEEVFSGEVRLSRVYETPALLKPGSPKDWDIPYYNAASCGRCALAPSEILRKVKHIEQRIGRRDCGVWAPREIDVDILLYGSHAIAEPDLTVPHPLIFSRPFVLAPLADLFPGDGVGYKAALCRLPENARPKLLSQTFSTEKCEA